MFLRFAALESSCQAPREKRRDLEGLSGGRAAPYGRYEPQLSVAR